MHSKLENPQVSVFSCDIYMSFPRKTTTSCFDTNQLCGFSKMVAVVADYEKYIL